MVCRKCGKAIKENARFCPHCGTKVESGALAPGTGIGTDPGAGGGRQAMQNAKGHTLESSASRKGNSAPASPLPKGILIALVFGISAAVIAGGAFYIRSQDKSKLAGGGGKDSPIGIEETTQLVEEDTAAEYVAGAKKEESSGGSDTKGTAAKEDMYSISASTLCSRELHDFFQLHLGCYVNWVYGNCKTEPVNISSMREHTGVIGYFTIEEGMRVVDDYKEELFMLKMAASDLSGKVRKKDSVSYSCSVHLEAANIPEPFRYYKGTDAHICLVAEVKYYIDDEQVSFYNPYVTVVLENDAGDPDKWLISSAIFIDKSDYQNVNGDFFAYMNVNEDEKDAVAAINEGQDDVINWKKAYLDVIQAGEMDVVDTYCLKDINGDGIPELFTSSPFMYYQAVIWYIKGDGTADNVGGSGYTSDKIVTGDSRQNVTYDIVYQYDRHIGEYVRIFDGYIEEDWSDPDKTTYRVNEQPCSKEEYEAQYHAVWDSDASSYWDDCQLVSEKSLIQAIAEYELDDEAVAAYHRSRALLQTNPAPASEAAGSSAPQDLAGPSGDYILPDSGSRYLAESEIRALSKEEMRLARNEVYARHGRKFDSEDLQAYFNSKPWYKGTTAPKDFNEAVLNEFEKANLDLIRAVEGD